MAAAAAPASPGRGVDIAALPPGPPSHEVLALVPALRERLADGLPPGTLLPARYRCLPDAAIAAEIERRGPGADAGAIRARLEAALRPVFTALRYGQPGYAQLSRACPEAIRRGAADEGEDAALCA